MKLIPLLLIISSSHLGYSQKSVQNDSTIKTSKTIIELEDAKTIFKEKKTDFWDKYSSGLIAAFTVFVSLGISVWQARSSRKHTKANIISEARVEWIQNLRPQMGLLISDISTVLVKVNVLKSKYYDLRTNQIRTDLTPEQRERRNSEFEKVTPIVYKIADTFNQVKLFLNRKETAHASFIETVDHFAENFMDIDNIADFEGELVQKAQIILKDAWEQAKK